MTQSAATSSSAQIFFWKLHFCRCLPDISSSEKHCVKLDFKLPAKQMDGSGDGASDGDKLTISNKGDVGEGDASLVNKGICAIDVFEHRVSNNLRY